MFTPARSRFLLALACSIALLACGGGRPGTLTSCQHDRDCPAGQGCLQGACQALPCGGCQPEEACGQDGKCAPAQGAACATNTCPAGYPCNGSVCAKPCTLDGDCDRGFVCNSQLHSCAQCTFDQQCANVTGKTHCDGSSGTCVACNLNIDCVTALGSGHFCDAHVCKPGCQKDTDCSASAGERCDGATATTPGRCIQCKSNQECTSSAPACDDTGHCVGCWGTTQSAANSTCSPGAPECDLTSKTCVACLSANDAAGTDCGYSVNGIRDPHNAQICGAAHACVAGCTTDAECGCPRNPSPNGPESTCGRYANAEHCDPARTNMNGAASVGACVQCRPAHDEDCSYRVKGSTLYGGAYAGLNGARCQNDSCVEGCDSDANCPSGRICHLGQSGDPLNHKCVECACDVPGADPTYCEVNSAGTAPACAPTASGSPRVCDKATLLCRKKRQNESCTPGQNECGDVNDPTVPSSCSPLSVCVTQAQQTVGGVTYCAADHATGRCGIPCNDLQNNACAPGASCPGSSCRQATADVGPNTYCVANSCSYP